MQLHTSMPVIVDSFDQIGVYLKGNAATLFVRATPPYDNIFALHSLEWGGFYVPFHMFSKTTEAGRSCSSSELTVAMVFYFRFDHFSLLFRRYLAYLIYSKFLLLLLLAIWIHC